MCLEHLQLKDTFTSSSFVVSKQPFETSLVGTFIPGCRWDYKEAQSGCVTDLLPPG